MSLQRHQRRLSSVFTVATLSAIAACSGRLETIDAPNADAAVDAAKDGTADSGANCTPIVGKDDGCTVKVTLPCGIAAPDAGYFTTEQCKSICGQSFIGGCGVGNPTEGGDEGKVYEVNCFTCVAGRRPTGFAAGEGSVSFGGWLAQMAQLECASINAFDHLFGELKALGAPSSILSAIERAKTDEQRHTRVMLSLAGAAGAEVKLLDSMPATPKTALEVAIENAVEGCVRETFGALVASWQATHAEHAPLRIAMKRIASDERNHAALSWRIDAWLRERVSGEEGKLVNEAMVAAIAVLKRDAYVAFGPAERALGLPNKRQTDALIATLEEHLWGTTLAA